MCENLGDPGAARLARPHREPPQKGSEVPNLPDIETIFTPRSRVVRELLAGDAAYEMPVFQRPYRWEDDAVRDLLEDSLLGLNRLVGEPDAVTFIGATITVTGTEGKHRDPPGVAARVIDGQQRLTTVLMACVVGHEAISRRIEDLASVAAEADDEPADAMAWALEQVQQVREDLWDCLFVVKVGG